MRYNGSMNLHQVPMEPNQPFQRIQGWGQGLPQSGASTPQNIPKGNTSTSGMNGWNPYYQGGYENLEGIQSPVPHYQTENWNHQTGKPWGQKPYGVEPQQGQGWSQQSHGGQEMGPYPGQSWGQKPFGDHEWGHHSGQNWGQEPYVGQGWSTQQGHHLESKPEGAPEWKQPKGENWNYTYMRPDGPSQKHHKPQPPTPSYSHIPKEPSDKEVQQSVDKKYQHLSREVLRVVRPWVQYGLKEAKYTSYEYVFTKITAITYLIGKGHEPKEAEEFVESWASKGKFNVKGPVLQTIAPWVQYGLSEASYTSNEHALTEVAAVTYLIGQGYEPKQAHYIVESWEVHEEFQKRY